MNVEHAQLSMNIFDAVIVAVLAVSALVAFFRGFVREVLSLGAWVGAAVITMYLFPQSTRLVHQHVKSDHVAAGAAALGTYLAALLTLSLINAIIIRYIKTGAEVGILDNALGLVFGTARGLFVVSLAFLIMSAVVPKDNPPAWLKNSVTKPYLEKGADVLAKAAPGYLSHLEEIVKNQQAQQGEKIPDEEGVVPSKDGVPPATGEQAQKRFQNFMNSLQTQSQGTQDENH